MALLLTRGDLQRTLALDQVIEAVAGAFAAYSAGRTETPLRVGVEPPGTGGVLLAMPSAVADPPALGAKIVSVFRGNVARGLPTVTSIYVLSDYETGAPLAIMDGSYLTAVRTAAGSAVSARVLARADAAVLGVFGTGVQARFHVLAMRGVRPLAQVLVCGTSFDKAAGFAGWVTETTGLSARAASAADVSAADIVAACTTSAEPVVVEDAVRPGSHVCSVGSFTPATRELPTGLIAKARVYVDSRAGAFSEAGDLLIPVHEGVFELGRVVGEVGEVLNGTVPGRQTADEVTVYKSVGAAFLDAATARLAYAAAAKLTVGTVFEFDAE
ncbi:MAG TPA: ornithine cyclodeaminase family protein [Chloroflexota bacterium]|jgi:ornithine cyclodeaminase/alanine dehydrogenase-like protein (mu-crystallin family)|nr:ornithine cyclodeaminase family protein [Chloroflexota bacterium]